MQKIIAASFAIFSAFFGSGNLIYPIFLGALCSDHIIFGLVGFLFANVFIATIGMMGPISDSINPPPFKHREYKITSYFAELGRFPSFAVALLLLLILGPFGAQTRCLLLCYGSFQSLSMDFNIIYFSLFFCFISFLLSFNQKKTVDILGLVLTPFLIFILIVIIFCGIFAPSNIASSNLNPVLACAKGIKIGYNTMDLIIAPYAGIMAINYFKNDNNNGKKYALISCLLAALLLLLIYIGFAIISAKYSVFLNSVSLDILLITIVKIILGDLAAWTIMSTVFFACITTVVAIAYMICDFTLRDLSIPIKNNVMIFVNHIAIFAVSLFGFEFLQNHLNIILDLLYPSVIAFVIFKAIKSKYTKTVFYIVLTTTIISTIMLL